MGLLHSNDMVLDGFSRLDNLGKGNLILSQNLTLLIM